MHGLLCGFHKVGPVSDDMSEPQIGHPQYSRRGWKIAGLGLLITFNYAFAFLLPVIDLFIDDGYSYLYWSIFTVTIGTPIAFVGLLLSILDKWRIGRKNIMVETIILVALFGNTFFWATLGTIGP